MADYTFTAGTLIPGEPRAFVAGSMRTGERIAIRIWLFEDEDVLATADVDGEIAALTAPAVVLGHAAAAVSRRGHVLGSGALELGTTEPPGSLLC